MRLAYFIASCGRSFRPSLACPDTEATLLKISAYSWHNLRPARRIDIIARLIDRVLKRLCCSTRLDGNRRGPGSTQQDHSVRATLDLQGDDYDTKLGRQTLEEDL
jgi:hypothetical protein